MLLMEFRADVDIEDAKRNTPLHYAVYNGNLKLVKIILSKFPRMDIENIEGLTQMQIPMRQDLKYVTNHLFLVILGAHSLQLKDSKEIHSREEQTYPDTLNIRQYLKHK